MSRSFVAIVSAAVGLCASTIGAQSVVTPAGAPPQPAPMVRTVSPMRVPLEAAVVKSAPYSAEIVIESIQTLADGNRIINRTTGRVYRDSEGRIRREEDRPSGGPSISISDPTSGDSYSLDTANHIAWKTPGRAAVKILEQAKVEELNDVLKKLAAVEQARVAAIADEARRSEETRKAEIEAQGQRERRVEAQGAGGFGGRAGGGGARGRGGAVNPEQRVEENLPAKQIEGVRAEGIRRTATIPAGAIGNVLPIKIVTEEWTSPDLKVLVLTQHSDPRAGETTYRLQNIVRGEPNAAFFQVPADYVVRETGIRRFERR